MHRYLRAVGFSNIENKKQVRDLMNDVIVNPNRKEFIETGRDSILVEYSKNYCPTCGITLRGEYDDSNNPVIHGVEKISTPGRRVYSGYKDLPRIYNGLGTLIVSTSAGVTTGKKASEKMVGGELVCKVW